MVIGVGRGFNRVFMYLYIIGVVEFLMERIRKSYYGINDIVVWSNFNSYYFIVMLGNREIKLFVLICII